MGLRDGSAEIARRLGAQVLSAARGRGTQLYAGVAASRGEVLFFLHADSVFPQGGLRAISRQLERHPRAVGGNFRLLYDSERCRERPAMNRD